MLTIESAHSPKFMNATGDEIDLMVKFAEVNQELPFTARPVDSQDYCVELFNNAVAGMYGDVAPYVPPPPPPSPNPEA